MASGTNYSQEYGQAEKAYLESNFAQAAEIIDHLADEFPNDPNVLLLRGHIYCYGFQNYDLARHQYESVLDLSDEQDLIDFARSGIEQLEQLQQQEDLEVNELELESVDVLDDQVLESEDSISVNFPNEAAYEEGLERDNNDYGSKSNYDLELEDGFDQMSDLGTVPQTAPKGDSDSLMGSSFHLSANGDEGVSQTASEIEIISDSGLDHSFVPTVEDSLDSPFSETYEDAEDLASVGEEEEFDDPFAEFESESNFVPETATNLPESEPISVHTTSTFMVDAEEEGNFPEYTESDFTTSQTEHDHEYDDSSELEIDTVLTEPLFTENDQNYNIDISEQENLNYQDELEFDEIDSSFFDLEELEQGLPDTGLFNVAEDNSSASLNVTPDLVDESQSFEPDEIAISDINPHTTTSVTTVKEEPQIEVKQGTWANFINAPIQKKQFITAGVTGLISAIAVLGIGIISSNLATRQNPQRTLVEGVQNSLLLALVAGLSSAGTAAALGSITARHVTKASRDLQNQFDDVYQGNLNAKATVYSQDEFGQLAADFNRMTRVILTTTQEAQRRAEETEQAKEDLQRQVIRLLDDVEGAARGDLTVQATVTADVLGAVADAFNLTIQSLREIVRQVKEAAEQVNQGSTDSELFARNQSSEALRMAEELAVTLNSVQMMTESIERVADNAREAEEVARSSSVTALKGGKAVERTVSGIFQIRETVSETARKVKRLAEASQEISKIVLLISQIAERTNQLALNASIQAAKAGEAGRGFAVVADEVRQLADRSGKSLKEIEQIVLQIQSETGSVMTAMEEGIQEVIDVTERAEQAKTALEDIIQVSNRIDTLVRSITADTVEQRENSRAVAQVMQSVELTAQATSQESQRVGGALQSLVGIARGLLSSVERFRIDKGEE
ncbi:MAG: methyl-accepting chemotaxis protein [Cyanobacteria bacterium P01_A01_bin.83]